MNTATSLARFTSGTINITQGIAVLIALAPAANDELREAFSRHLAGDWGELETEDKEANEHDIIYGQGRLLSKYTVYEQPIYICTNLCDDSDDNYTVAMLTEEY